MKKTVYLLAALLALGCNTLEQNPVDKLFESNAFQTEAEKMRSMTDLST